MPGNDSSNYNEMLWQALMAGGQKPQPSVGGMAGAGQTMPATAQNPTTQWGQSFMTGNPTVPGNGPDAGMLGTSPYQTVNPNAPAGTQAPGTNPLQGYDPFTLLQGNGMEAYPQLRRMAGNVWDGGGGGAEG